MPQDEQRSAELNTSTPEEQAAGSIDDLGSKAVAVSAAIINGEGVTGTDTESTEVYTPTEAELEQGLKLDKDQTVAFQLFDSQSGVENPYFMEFGQAFDSSDREKFGKGRELARVVAGDPDEFKPSRNASVTVYENEDGKKILAIMSQAQPGSEPYRELRELRPGEKFTLGRSGEYEDKLSLYVSGKHVTVWLDEQGRFVVQNHQSGNPTVVSRIDNDDKNRSYYQNQP